jgi:hypothetical protein
MRVGPHIHSEDLTSSASDIDAGATLRAYSFASMP